MCGIFGIVSNNRINLNDLKVLANHSRQRGIDSSGIIQYDSGSYNVNRADYDISRLFKKLDLSNCNIVMGHSRLITNGLLDNQPVTRDGLFAIHNGIIVNDNELWNELESKRKFKIDSEIILGIAIDYLNSNDSIEGLSDKILELCDGTISAVLGIPKLGKLLLFSNNGSLYVGEKKGQIIFASESFALKKLNCRDIVQIKKSEYIIDIPQADKINIIDDEVRRKINLIPQITYNLDEESLLVYPNPKLKRCSKCILPETMPFIEFDEKGVCNYCNTYKQRNNPKPKEDLFNLVKPYRKQDTIDCIVPFSGGRDSSYALHLVVNELKMNPIAYTYDWGMVNDLGRRNISRMCSKLGVENIIVAADITKKRRNIALNLKAWLKSPHLGMISILTAGDKHFFQHVETIKRQTGVNLNLWGINPLEVTHFKSGFLGMKPEFNVKRVYMTGLKNQIIYHSLRFKAMLESPGYFNRSLWDSWTGEFYRSFGKKSDYYHLFDYWKWDESIIDETLKSYGWEYATDTDASWRIGDGTAAFYNYIYYTVAGFTEHDTFRSNQIREGQLTRSEALKLVAVENKPRYENIKWYLDTLEMDYKEVVSIINKIPRLYEE